VYVPGKGDQGVDEDGFQYTTVPSKGTWIDVGSANAPRGYNVSLLQHELAGGHTIAFHVAKTIAFLRNRANTDPDVSVASTFYSLRQATALINMTLNQNRIGIDVMMAKPGNAWATLYATFNRPTGHSVTEGVNGYDTVNSVFILIRKPAATPEGFVIWTSFPTKP
jgi:hypothetical protein